MSDQAANQEIEISIVMPCLNEELTVGACIKQALTFLKEHQLQGEVIIADNGSTDQSIVIAESSGARIVKVKERGYGSAIFHGAHAACGKYLIIGDADQSYDFSALMPFIAKLRQGYDLVMGNRFRGGIAEGAMPWLNRWIGNPVLTTLGRLFFRSPAGDFHCGLRGCRKTAFEKLDLQTAGMEFASEMVIKATLLGLSIAEVPTTLSPDGRQRRPHLRPWRDGWRHLRFMLLYSPRWLFLYPGTVLTIFGLVLGARLSIGPWGIGGVSLDVHTLLFAALFVLVGVESITFAVFSKVYAAAEGLLPVDPRLQNLGKKLSLESGIAAGVILFLVGVVLSIRALLQWKGAGFGSIDPAVVLRTVIPGMLFIALGVHLVLASFFLSVLSLRLRKDRGGEGV